jgi:hypothetical protein
MMDLKSSSAKAFLEYPNIATFCDTDKLIEHQLKFPEAF